MRRKHLLGGAPSDISLGDSGDDVSDNSFLSQPAFNIICINIRCLLKNLAELICRIEILRPQLFLLQKTWLDASVESIDFPNYVIVSRRDRSQTSNRGGVIVFCRIDVKKMLKGVSLKQRREFGF